MGFIKFAYTNESHTVRDNIIPPEYLYMGIGIFAYHDDSGAPQAFSVLGPGLASQCNAQNNLTQGIVFLLQMQINTVSIEKS